MGGRIVETGVTDDIFYRPSHPYNLALQQSVPALQTKGKTLYSIDGLPPDLSKPMNGCSFAPRCQHRSESCMTGELVLKPLHDKTQQMTNCLRVQDGSIQL